MSAPSFTYSGNVYTAGVAGTVDFPLTSTTGNAIPYLEPSHIHVYESADDGVTWTELTRPAQWDFVSSGTVARLAAGISSGEWVKVQRITPSDAAYVTFQASSLLTAEQLNNDTLFNTYLNQEQEDTSAIAAVSSASSAAAAEAAATAASASAATASSNAATAVATANSAASAAATATSTANSAVSTANAATATATNAVTIATGVASLSKSSVEAAAILVNASFGIGKPGETPFGVGPYVPSSPAIAGLSQGDYSPVHSASGSFL